VLQESAFEEKLRRFRSALALRNAA
jgi:hypothetical protein